MMILLVTKRHHFVVCRCYSVKAVGNSMEPTLSLTALTEEILSNLQKNNKAIAEGSRQKGRQYAFEGCIQDSKLTQQQKQVEKYTDKADGSLSKNEHQLVVETEDGLVK